MEHARRADRRWKSPPSARIAPPGRYMLFAFDERGVPSVAHWVNLG